MMALRTGTTASNPSVDGLDCLVVDDMGAANIGDGESDRYTERGGDRLAWVI